MEAPQPSPGELPAPPDAAEQPASSFEGSDPLAEEQRVRLVASLRESGVVKSASVEEALLRVPRHLFLPQVPLAQAYADIAVPTHWEEGQPVSSASQPAMVALMLEQLQVTPGMRVLEVGAGTGYNAALLAELAGPQGQVTTLELDPQIVDEAREHLGAAGYGAARVLAKDGWEGDWDGAPYDRIVLTAGASDISPAWCEQLADNGLLVLPLWLRAGEVSVALRKRWGRLQSESMLPCGFMPLRGMEASLRQWTALPGGRRLMGERARELADPVCELLAQRPRPRLWLPPSPALAQYLSLIGLVNLALWTEPGRARRAVRIRQGIYVADEENSSLVLFTVGRPLLFCYGSPAAERALDAALARSRGVSLAPLEQWRVTAYPAGDASMAPMPPPGVVRLARRNFVFDVDPTVVT